MNDAYLVHRDTLLSVVERYISFNTYINREELAALLNIALPKEQTAPNPDPDLEALKRVLTPEPVMFHAPKMEIYDDTCVDQFPDYISRRPKNDPLP